MTVASPFSAAPAQRHLRQHEDRGRRRVRRQGAPVQPALSPDVRPLSGRTDRLHAGGGLGEGRSKIRSVWCASASSRRVCGSTSYEEMNAWLLDRCVAHAKAITIPRCGTGRCGRCSRPSAPRWCPTPAGSMASTARRRRSRRPAWCASTTTSTRSRPGRSVGPSKSRPMPTASWSARTARSSPSMPAGSAATRPSTIPGTTFPSWPASQGSQNGAPFQDWVLPGALGRVRARLAAAADGDRQMVDILSAVLTDGLAAVEAACGEALRDGVQRRHPQHPGPPPGSRRGTGPHPRRPAPSTRTGRRLRPV